VSALSACTVNAVVSAAASIAAGARSALDMIPQSFVGVRCARHLAAVV
jgi:hypothetical protein